MFSAFGELSLTSAETPVGLIPTYGQPEWVRETLAHCFDFLLELFELMLENHDFMLEKLCLRKNIFHENQPKWVREH